MRLFQEAHTQNKCTIQMNRIVMEILQILLISIESNPFSMFIGFLFAQRQIIWMSQTKYV